jgi:hypothetical protein
MKTTKSALKPVHRYRRRWGFGIESVYLLRLGDKFDRTVVNRRRSIPLWIFLLIFVLRLPNGFDLLMFSLWLCFFLDIKKMLRFLRHISRG